MRAVPPPGFALASGWIALERPGEFRDDVGWKCDNWRCHELAIYGETGGPCRVACAEHAVEFGAIVPVQVPPPPIEVRVIPGDGGSWTVEGWRGGVRRYIRAYNRTADEAWSYGADWMREEMMNAKETKSCLT